MHVAAEMRSALLLVALEPAAPRARIESALVLLKRPAALLDAALRLGLLREIAGRVEVADSRLSRVLAQQVTERERRLAHLALACSGLGDVDSRDAWRSFDSLRARLESPAAGPLDTPMSNALTPQEQRVAALAATGARSREIARTVCVSQKTVEYHLTRIYRKLGVRSKAELAYSLGSQ